MVSELTRVRSNVLGFIALCRDLIRLLNSPMGVFDVSYGKNFQALAGAMPLLPRTG